MPSISPHTKVGISPSRMILFGNPASNGNPAIWGTPQNCYLEAPPGLPAHHRDHGVRNVDQTQAVTHNTSRTSHTPYLSLFNVFKSSSSSLYVDSWVFITGRKQPQMCLWSDEIGRYRLHTARCKHVCILFSESTEIFIAGGISTLPPTSTR